jgi:hypothetical protein
VLSTSSTMSPKGYVAAICGGRRRTARAAPVRAGERRTCLGVAPSATISFITAGRLRRAPTFSEMRRIA